MKTKELRLNFHHLIDEIENEKILTQFYDLLKTFKRKNDKKDFWDLFSKKQKLELELAWEESEKEENLVSHDEIMKEAKKWLKK